jgi:hypothetical protein
MSAGGIRSCHALMTKKLNPDPASEATQPPHSLEKAEKGSHRSMWELLLQLRVVLPYLARLVPLLDRGILKAGPDLTEFNKGFATMQTSSRDLEVQARNQALQLERIEQQMGRMRLVHESSIEESRKLVAEISALRRVFLTMSIVMAVLLGATVGMVAYLVVRS